MQRILIDSPKIREEPFLTNYVAFSAMIIKSLFWQYPGSEFVLAGIYYISVILPKMDKSKAGTHRDHNLAFGHR
jgi:hypothetical protein